MVRCSFFGLSKFLSSSHSASRKWFTVLSSFVSPLLFFINAPFGRFTLKNQSDIFLVDGRYSWVVMELPSPILFTFAFLTSPLSGGSSNPPSLCTPNAILALCFLAHYLNRAILSPLRTPSRSKSHVIVPLAAIAFNVVNGFLMGSYLSSPAARISLAKPSPRFYLGVALWAAGAAGNIFHDEILLNIRRKAISKGKGKANGGEHYAIPNGGLYSFISYPNYFCEWIEWLGFAIAASPVPNMPGLSTLLDPQTFVNILTTAPDQWAPSLTPPWIFLINEIILMLPRAFRGHQWYHNKFGDSYPRQRKAVIPFLA